jgi:hypothetical protein
MTTTSNDKSVNQATHGSGNGNADHGTGSDKQRQQRGVENTTVPPKETAPGRLPQRAASNERSPWPDCRVRSARPKAGSTG